MFKIQEKKMAVVLPQSVQHVDRLDSNRNIIMCIDEFIPGATIRMHRFPDKNRFSPMDNVKAVTGLDTDPAGIF